ncbi:uncharacterized protein LOC129774895 [Toxorhynchites rutilus septentrionalis]|uniref:uncharacterized protein LOC129774895 n=1 Tax=Toxorhynchites rutilus septentrionalis TaxID=329112 RepID=UPI00247B1877|nr:uncharacterized protein LOC129774895 [Toxorhynchites rutilus septentrionalis]
MFSDQDINRQNYKLRFQEMENKIKQCELQRTDLEQKFAQLMRERQECEKVAARSLKAKYQRMMELEKQRAERNESLLRMLHKIDQQAASLAAKTDRLKMLKTQYETYLMRSWSSQRALPPSPNAPLYSPQPQLLSPVPQTSPYLFPRRTTDSPKSEFVKYLSDMTHVQTVAHSPIPPPMALSNYISSNPPLQSQHFPAGYHYPSPMWSQDPFLKPSHAEATVTSPTDYNPVRVTESVIPPTPRRTVPAQSSNKKFELSNEEFIQYIDNEILKGSTNSSESHNLQAPEIVVDSPPPVASTPLPAAYLEDITNDEDNFPSASNLSSDSLMVEEAVEKVAKLNLGDTASADEKSQPLLAPMATFAMSQPPWEEIAAIGPQSTNDPLETVEPINEVSLHLHTDVTELPFPGTGSEGEGSQWVPPEETQINQLEFVPEREGVREQIKDEPLEDPTTFQLEYQRANPQEEDYQQPYYSETDYQSQQQQEEQPQQLQYYSETEYQPEQFADEQEKCQEDQSPEYTQQENISYNYDSTSVVEQQQQQPQVSERLPNLTSRPDVQGQNYWTTARQAVKSKTYPGMVPSRTPETIQEIVDNGEEQPTREPSVPHSPVEQPKLTLPGSKRGSPTGENVSASETHVSEPDVLEQPAVELVSEQQPTEQQMVGDPVQYDYTQFSQEYDPAVAEQQQEYQYQQDASDQQYYQYPDQSGQDTSQEQEYQGYADPNQYQQATEYPGPTEYVYEQAYYEQQQQQQLQQDPNQQAYYDPNAPTDPQYYSGDKQQQAQQQSDQSYYDQSQTQDAYEQYQISEPLAPHSAEDSAQPQGEADDSTKVDQSPGGDSLPVISQSESGGEKNKEPTQDGKKTTISPGATVEEKNDTTISSTNDESDFDFSTQ